MSARKDLKISFCIHQQMGEGIGKCPLPQIRHCCVPDECLLLLVTRDKKCLHKLHRVWKTAPPLACYSFHTRERILIFWAEMLPISKQSKDTLLCQLK